MRHQKSILLAASLLALIFRHQTASAEDAVRVSIADQEITPFCLKMRMVRHPNFSQMRDKYKLDFESTMQVMSQAPISVANHDIDVGECTGISTMVNAWNKGAKNLVIWSVGAIVPVYQLVANPSIKTLADLKGKNIGTPGLQTASSEAVEMILKRGAGLLPNKDYNYVQTGGGSTRAAALIARKIDALPTFPPVSYDLERRGFPVIADEVTTVPEYVSGVDIVTREWADQHRDLFLRVVKASIGVGQWLKDPGNKDAAIKWFAENVTVTGGEPIGPVDAAKMYDFYIAQHRLSFDGYASESSVRANLSILQERGYLKPSEVPPLGQLFDFSYLNAALKELNLPIVQEYAKN